LNKENEAAEKHRPQRMCISCRLRKPQAELIRIGYNEKGELGVQKFAIGRSCYVCPQDKCIGPLFEKSKLDRAIKKNISDLDRAKLKQELSSYS
jgi:predicted RNA-binding protein YlxR (DUF448 family)